MSNENNLDLHHVHQSFHRSLKEEDDVVIEAYIDGYNELVKWVFFVSCISFVFIFTNLLIVLGFWILSGRCSHSLAAMWRAKLKLWTNTKIAKMPFIMTRSRKWWSMKKSRIYTRRMVLCLVQGLCLDYIEDLVCKRRAIFFFKSVHTYC